MLKRLIEVALPLKEVSEQSAREKSIRHGHISTLHIWWARRPLATCRAMVFASLIPDPDDPECPESFRSLVNELLNESDYKPKNGDGAASRDTPRNRCLEFLKFLVKWENSNKPHYIEPARKLIAAAHKILHPNAQGDAPKVLDPFAGGGAIPLEALRLGCEAHALDLNPVAHLIQLCTLVYPQQHGQPNSRPVPNYVKRLIAHNKAKKKAKGQETSSMFDSDDAYVESADDFVPTVEITEAEYLKNPLAADVKYWGHWVLTIARSELGRLYAQNDSGEFPIAYLWARTFRCPNPLCQHELPLVTSCWLYDKPKLKVAVKIESDKNKNVIFRIVQNDLISFNPDLGTVQRGSVCCPFCQITVAAGHLQKEFAAGGLSQALMAVVTASSSGEGRAFREPTQNDLSNYESATHLLEQAISEHGDGIIPAEAISTRQPRLMWVTTYGLKTWASLYNKRQLLAMTAIVRLIETAGDKIAAVHGNEYRIALSSYFALAMGRLADYNSSLCRWAQDFVGNTFGRQGLPMVWNYCEAVPIGDTAGNLIGALDWICRVILELTPALPRAGSVERGSATRLPFENGSIETVITDPPYYDAVPYGDLSDYFYVWHKRVLSRHFPERYRTPLTPKQHELIEERPHSSVKNRKDRGFYERGMAEAFGEQHRVLANAGIGCVMFAHKTTVAWETLIAALLKSGLCVTASWPFHTERPGRLIARGTAALASSVTLVCRKRVLSAGSGFWDDVRKELKVVAKERLDFFWSQSIRGADFFISAIGPALSVFGKYERVTKLSGDEVSVGQFLDEVRSLVTAYALSKIMKTTQMANIDPDSQFYVIWKWSYGEAKVPADESFKLAQALGMDTETMWDRTGILEKAGENVLAVPVAKRMKIKNLGEPNADTTPASLIDVLHRLCVFRDKNDTEGMAEFLGRSGQGRNSNLWLVAQAVSEILPDGDKEKQLMQGLLNQRDQLQKAGEQGKLF